MSESNKSVVLPTFTGNDEDFQTWWTKFLAFATAKGVVEALLGKEANLPAQNSTPLDESNDAEKLQIKARNRNNLAMAYLMTAFQSDADLSLTYEAMDDDWPGGLAYKVVEQLKEIYQPKDSITEVELYDKLMKVRMN